MCAISQLCVLYELLQRSRYTTEMYHGLMTFKMIEDEYEKSLRCQEDRLLQPSLTANSCVSANAPLNNYVEKKVT